MKRSTLRRRVLLLLIQWCGLVLVALVVATLWSQSIYRREVTAERLLLARSIAQAVDLSVGSARQALGRLAQDLPTIDVSAAASLRAFRFHSTFHHATYLLTAQGALVAADPPGAAALPISQLGDRVAVTGLLTSADHGGELILALVQPFTRQGHDYLLVAELEPRHSPLNAMLSELQRGGDAQISIVDESGVVIAAADDATLLTAVPEAPWLREPLRTHREFDSSATRSASEVNAATIDHTQLVVMAPLRFAPWGVLLRQPEVSAFSAYHRLQHGFLLAMAGLALAGVVLVRGVSRAVIKPLLALSRQAQRLRSGDLATPISADGVFEIDLLASTLDEARERLGATLASLEGLNRGLERQVQQRTETLAAQTENLKLLHRVAQVSLRRPDPERLVPEILRLIAEHHRLPAAVLIHTPGDRAPSVYLHPEATAAPWARAGEPPPADWLVRPLEHRGAVIAQLYLPAQALLEPQVMEALESQLALSLAGGQLWQRTIEHDAQRRVLVRRLMDAGEEERRRIARELHDEISQLLTLIQLSIDQIPGGDAAIARAKDLLKKTQQDVHRIIYDLRPSQIDDLGLPAALQAHARSHLTAHGLQVNLEIDETLHPSPEVAITVFRIFQEVVTNILRHANAQQVSVELYENAGRLTLAVQDDGVGFDPGLRGEGVGLVGMRERAGLVGATLRVDSEPGDGTQVVLEVPRQP